ncbi:MAG: hypothetical protein JWP12_1504 [Bacteroidetes bacterium]|nr:hypothetical protein [Bacteroidota bacterium]
MLALLLCQLYTFAQANKIDSLRTVLPTLKQDTSIVNTLNLLSRQLFIKGKYDTAMLCANNAKALAEKSGYKKGIGLSYNSIGNINFTKGKQDEALDNYSTALKFQKEVENLPGVKKGIAASYSNIGNIYIGRGNYDEALKNYAIALKLRLEIVDKQDIAISYSNIGVVYYYQGNYPEALKNYLLALKLEKEIGDNVAIARTYNNSGNIYLQQENYSEALKNYFAAILIQKQVGDKQGIGRAFNNIGNVYFLQKKYDKALHFFFVALQKKTEIGDRDGIGRSFINIGNSYYTQSFLPGVTPAEHERLLNDALTEFMTGFRILEDVDDQQGVAMSYNDIGVLYVAQHKTADAIDYLNNGLAVAKAIGSKEDIKASYTGLASADSASGNFKSAYEHHKLFLIYRDSLLNEESTKKTVQAQMNFDFEQKEIKQKAEQDQKDAIYREKIKRQKVIAWSAAGIFGFILLSAFLLFNRSRLKQKNLYQQKLNQQQKEQAVAVMETQEQERKRIAEDLHDSLGHLLSTIKLNLQTLPEEQKQYYVNSLQLLNQASTEIHNISFDLMPQTLEEEGLVPALRELADKIRRSSLYDIMLQVHDMDNFTLDKQTKFNIYRIVQEAVNNILKHAEAKEINIQLIKQDDHLTIMIEDDGKGFNKADLKMNGRGLRNITARSEWLDGTITIDSTPGRGTTIVIEIPVNLENEH